MHTFYTPDIAVKAELPEEEAAHCLRVLRLTIGDEVRLTDGKGYFYKAVIDAIAGKRCQVKVLETIFQDPLSFLNCRFSERKVIKPERIEKIVVSAVKQSLKARKPEVNDMIDFDKFVKQDFKGQKFIAHCYEGEKPLLKDVLDSQADALVLIGPEGDFSREEVALAESCGFQPISLGRSRLRTETAALVAVHLMNLAHASE